MIPDLWVAVQTYPIQGSPSYVQIFLWTDHHIPKLVWYSLFESINFGFIDGVKKLINQLSGNFVSYSILPENMCVLIIFLEV